MVSPSGMMDGQVAAIRAALDAGLGAETTGSIVNIASIAGLKGPGHTSCFCTKSNNLDAQPGQALILAHEQIHARRRDGLWRLLAQGFVAVFWFNPLAWIAMACFRQDQELACDAAVLREHGAEVVGVATVVDRATGAADVIAAEGLEYRSVLGLADLGL